MTKPASAGGLTRDLWIGLTLLLMIAAVYVQTWRHDFINYDDPAYVTENAQVRQGLSWDGVVWAFTSAHDANWIPLTWLSHMLDCEVFGIKSGPHHLVNVALHACSSVLLFALLKRMTGARWRSAFVAFIFALHPLHVESVAWVAERKDILSALFWFLTLWAYLKYTEGRSGVWYLVTLVLFSCGLMSKPMMVTWPFAALLLDAWPLGRIRVATGFRQVSRRVLLEKVPLLVLAIAASVVAYLVQGQSGTIAALDQIPLPTRIENALVSYVVYLEQLAWPSNLAVFYPYLPPPEWQWIMAGLGLAAVTFLLLRGSVRRPYLGVGWLWYLGTLLPVIGLVQVGGQARADRYTYLPMTGVAILLAWGAADYFERWRWGKRALAFAGITLCTAWLAVAWVNLKYWRNSISLFQHAIGVTADNYIAYSNLGVALKQEGQFAEAVSAFQNAVAIRPQDAQTQDNLGEALLREGKIAEAAPHLLEAVRLQPDSAKAHIDLGSALVQSGQAEQAAAQYQLALQLRPDSAEAHYGLGGVLMAQGRREESLPHLRQALPWLMDAVRQRPDDVDAHYNLGVLLGILGRNDEAITEFSAAVRLRPDDPEAHVNLGIALVARERLNEALDHFGKAVTLRPDYVNAHFNLGGTLTALDRYDEAIREYSEVLRLAPDDAEARRRLDYCLSLRKKSR